MTVEELLDQCRRDYLDDYTEMVSGSSDQLFRDSSLVRWFNEAERRICEEALVLKSFGPTNSAISQITLVTGQRDYDIDERVIRILAARPNDTEYDLVRLDYNTIRETDARYGDQTYFDSNSPVTATPGRPRWFATDVQLNSVRIRPAPSSTENGLVVNLRVAHYPMQQMTADEAGLQASPEIPYQYHHLLPLYAAAKALAVPNVDSEMRTAARGFQRDFDLGLNNMRRTELIKTMSPPRFMFGGWVNDGG